MRAALAIAFMLAAQPALACHRYSSWSYPWPQSCRTSSAAPVHQRTWFVEIKPEPPPPAPPAVEPEELTRQQGLDVLRRELRMRSTQALELQTLGLTMEEKRNGD
jgi:hypothetical protein